MRIVEFKRKDGKPLYAALEHISWWTESVDNSNHCEIQISGQKLYLAQTVVEVTKKIEGT